MKAKQGRRPKAETPTNKTGIKPVLRCKGLLRRNTGAFSCEIPCAPARRGLVRQEMSGSLQKKRRRPKKRPDPFRRLRTQMPRRAGKRRPAARSRRPASARFLDMAAVYANGCLPAAAFRAKERAFGHFARRVPLPFFQFRMLADFAARQGVAAVVAGVVGMAAHLDPFHGMHGRKREQFLP